MIACGPRHWVAWLALVACGTGAEPAGITILAQTDLAPGIEVERLVVQVHGRSADYPRLLADVVLEVGDDWNSAPRLLATLDPNALPSPARYVEVEAVDFGGRTRLRRRLAMVYEASRLEFRLLRSCLAVEEQCRYGAGQCLDEGECFEGPCLAGRCVPPSCQRGDEPGCPAPECVVDADCSSNAGVCGASARCDAGVCFVTVDHSSCGPGQRCDRRLGCVFGPGASNADGEVCERGVHCASGVCVRGQCCERACNACEACEAGRCVQRPDALLSEPGPETCDGIDQDCDQRIDESANPGTTEHCGACGFSCAASERCDGVRCTPEEDACASLVGVPCDDVLVTTLHPPVLRESSFGAALAVDGDLLVVGAPRASAPLGVSVPPEPVGLLPRAVPDRLLAVREITRLHHDAPARTGSGT
ncbi:MAG: hypothetical protein AAGH15_12795, partial [Myxococcota bacterium]